MNIISHCGLWDKTHPKNSRQALERAIAHGFGIETDFRDQNGRLVLSHNPPLDSEGLSLLDLLEMLSEVSPPRKIALNVKAMHLSELVKHTIESHDFNQFYFFDMSVPDQRNYLRAELPTLSRQSEYEKNPSFYSESKGVWLDAFESEWYDLDLIKTHLDQGKEVFIVSPELHQREPESLWQSLAGDDQLKKCPSLSLCTDRPIEARSFFQ